MNKIFLIIGIALGYVASYNTYCMALAITIIFGVIIHTYVSVVGMPKFDNS